MIYNKKSDNVAETKKKLIEVEIRDQCCDGTVMSKISKDEKVTLNHRGMPRSMKIFLVNILVACLCLNQVAGENQIENGKDELLSVRSLRNWFRIPEPSMIARVSKRGSTNAFFDIPDRNMVARVSKRGFFDGDVPKQMVARVSKKGFFVPDKSMVARVSKRGFFIPDRSMVARVSKKSIMDYHRFMDRLDRIRRQLLDDDIVIEDPYEDIMKTDPSKIDINNIQSERENLNFRGNNRSKRSAGLWDFMMGNFQTPIVKTRFRRNWHYVLDRPSRCLSCRSWH